MVDKTRYHKALEIMKQDMAKYIWKEQLVQADALGRQVGGEHYRNLEIQPAEYNHRNRLGFCEGCVVKYVTRWREKGGIEDLKKAQHFLDLLIQMEVG